MNFKPIKTEYLFKTEYSHKNWYYYLIKMNRNTVLNIPLVKKNRNTVLKYSDSFILKQIVDLIIPIPFVFL